MKLEQTYQHGAYGYLGASILTDPDISENIPVYFGSLPLHLATGQPAAPNEPVVLRNFDEAARIVGYTDDWKSFDLARPSTRIFATRSRRSVPSWSSICSTPPR